MDRSASPSVRVQRRHSRDAVSAAAGNALQDRRRAGRRAHAAVGAHLPGRVPRRHLRSHADRVRDQERDHLLARVLSRRGRRERRACRMARARRAPRLGPRDVDHPPVPAAESARPARSGWRRDARDQAAVHRRGRGAACRVHARAAERRRARRACDLLGGDVAGRRRRGRSSRVRCAHGCSRRGARR